MVVDQRLQIKGASQLDGVIRLVAQLFEHGQLEERRPCWLRRWFLRVALTAPRAEQCLEIEAGLCVHGGAALRSGPGSIWSLLA
jgi:hypothetical protein